MFMTADQLVLRQAATKRVYDKYHGLHFGSIGYTPLVHPANVRARGNY